MNPTGRCLGRVSIRLRIGVGALLVTGACVPRRAGDTTAPVPIPPPLPTAEATTPAPPPAPATSTPGGLVRITTDVMERARRYELIAPGGEYVGPVDGNGDPLIFEPITGYGDFSDADLFEVDPTEIVALQARCLQDQGFPVRLDPSGSGFDFTAVPPEQNQLAFAASIACKEGLHLPAPTPPNTDQRREQLAYLTLVGECLREHGFDVADPPSLDEFIELDGAWSPYGSLPPLDPAAFEELDRACPQWPVGGYGAWDPGDPLRPRT